jgi:hypothetical protein
MAASIGLAVVPLIGGGAHGGAFVSDMEARHVNPSLHTPP